MFRVINYEKLINEFSSELAYLQNSADFWYYIVHDQDMSSFMLQYVDELRVLANNLNILDEVYNKALKIYDFSNSGKEGYIPDENHIEEIHGMFEDRKYHNLI